MELFYSSGRRLAELVGLNLCDMDLRDRTVRVLGKGSRERIVLPQLRETMMLCTIKQAVLAAQKA
jgi:site-specific recombinase XerC